MEQLRADMMVESLTDLEKIIFTAQARINARDQGSKKERFQELLLQISEEVKSFLQNYEKLYCKNHKGTSWMVGDSITYADYAWLVMFEIVAQLGFEDTIAEAAPKLRALIERVREIPETKDYLISFKHTAISLPLFE